MTNSQEQVARLKNLELSDPERNLLAAGLCPKCERPIRGKYEPVPKGAHFMAPEIYETLRENNIDTQSGHKNTCQLRGLRIQ